MTVRRHQPTARRLHCRRPHHRPSSAVGPTNFGSPSPPSTVGRPPASLPSAARRPPPAATVAAACPTVCPTAVRRPHHLDPLLSVGPTAVRRPHRRPPSAAVGPPSTPPRSAISEPHFRPPSAGPCCRPYRCPPSAAVRWPHRCPPSTPPSAVGPAAVRRPSAPTPLAPCGPPSVVGCLDHTPCLADGCHW